MLCYWSPCSQLTGYSGLGVSGQCARLLVMEAARSDLEDARGLSTVALIVSDSGTRERSVTPKIVPVSAGNRVKLLGPACLDEVYQRKRHTTDWI